MLKKINTIAESEYKNLLNKPVVDTLGNIGVIFDNGNKWISIRWVNQHSDNKGNNYVYKPVNKLDNWALVENASTVEIKIIKDTPEYKSLFKQGWMFDPSFSEIFVFKPLV